MVRPLYLDPGDGRPDTAFGADWRTPFAIITGLFSIVFIPALFVGFGLGLAFLTGFLLRAWNGPQEVQEEQPAIQEEVIEARFVRFGRNFLDELPNRNVPILTVSPRPPSAVPREDTPVADPNQPETIPDAVVRDYARLADRAQPFAEEDVLREREGLEDGLVDGTESQGTEGDIYAGRVASFFRNGWTVPTTVPDQERRRLTAIADIHIGRDLQLVEFEIQRTSGNPLFDQSVIEQLTRLKEADQHLPPPPENMQDDYLGQTIHIRFSGRDANG
jgi:hypothetical protein